MPHIAPASWISFALMGWGLLLSLKIMLFFSVGVFEKKSEKHFNKVVLFLLLTKMWSWLHTFMWKRKLFLFIPLPSPWPVLSSLGVVCLLAGFILHWRGFFSQYWVGAMLILIFLGINWAWNLRSEGSLGGGFVKSSYLSFQVGILFFMLSEALFFFSFFWSTFDESWSPMLASMPMGSSGVPLMNTALLLGSAATLTFAHDFLMSGKLNISAMQATMILGTMFFIAQGMEYMELPFGFGDGPAFSSFFLITGFHGSHVVIGLSLLVLVTVHMSKCGLSSLFNVSFEGAAWYWHFVDVMWMFLVSSLYGPSALGWQLYSGVFPNTELNECVIMS